MYRYFLLLYLPLVRRCFLKHCKLVLRGFYSSPSSYLLVPDFDQNFEAFRWDPRSQSARAKPSLASMCTHGCLGPLDGENLYAKQLSEVSLYQCLGE